MSSQPLFVRTHDSFEPASSAQVLSAARRLLAHRIRRGAPLTSPRQVREFLAFKLGDLDHEVFAVILVDSRHRVIEYVELFRGTVDGASVHPREVVKIALEKGAAACVLIHNHPSGVQDASQSDELITRRLRDARALIDVRVLDHPIVAGAAVASFAEQGLL